MITAFDPEVPVEHDRQRKYPWDQWFDGQIWRLTPGVDFENHPLVIERQIRTRASARKVAVHIQHGPDYAYLNIQATARPEPSNEQQLQALVEDAVETAVEQFVESIEHDHDGHTINVGPSEIVQNDGEIDDPATIEAASSNEPAAPVAAPVEEATEVAAPAPELPPLPTAAVPEPAQETVVVEGVTIPVAPLPDPAAEQAWAEAEAPAATAVPDVAEAIQEMAQAEMPAITEEVYSPDPLLAAAGGYDTAVTPEGETVAVGTDEPTQAELDADTTQPEDVPQGDSSFGADLEPEGDTPKPTEEQSYDEQLASDESVPAPQPVPTPPAPAGPFQAPIPPVPPVHPPLPHPAPTPPNPFGGLLGQ